MNSQTLHYLQKDEVGRVIATGLANLYINKPEKQVKFLAEWLRNYSKNEK